MSNPQKKKNPDVSYILCVYNGEKYVSETLDSLLCQRNVTFEIIAVDDGSTDTSGTILKRYAQKDNRITIVTQSNLGLSIARNNGIVKAKGEFIASASQDDIYLPTKSHEQIAYLEKNRLDFCFTRVQLIDDAKQPVKHLNNVLYNRQLLNFPFTLFDVILRMPLCSPTFLCRRSCYKNIHWNPALFLFNDYHLWIQMFLSFKGGKVPNVLLWKRFSHHDEEEKYFSKYSLAYHYFEHRIAFLSALMKKIKLLRYVPNGMMKEAKVAKMLTSLESSQDLGPQLNLLAREYENMSFIQAADRLREIVSHLI